MCTPDRRQVWFIVNFTQKEYIPYKGTMSNMYRRVGGMFQKDSEGWSRWTEQDEIVWMSFTMQPVPVKMIRENFENVYGAEMYDHIRNARISKVYVTKESTDYYYKTHAHLFTSHFHHSASGRAM